VVVGPVPGHREIADPSLAGRWISLTAPAALAGAVVVLDRATMLRRAPRPLA
jgi:hypothetical protein